MTIVVALVVALIFGSLIRLFPKPQIKSTVLFNYAFDPEVVRRTVTAATGKFETATDRLIGSLRYPELVARWREEDAAQLADFRAEVLAKEVASVPPAPAPTAALPGAFFRQNEPQTFADYMGQDHIVRLLEVHIKALSATERVIDHFCLTGVPGQGKTLLAKITAAELDRRAEARGLARVPFFESFAIDLDSIEAMDAAVKQLQEAKGGVWLIDEIHLLDESFGTKLYTLMTDGRYSFHGELSTQDVPDVTVIGATTNYGEMHNALKRRFGEPFRLRPSSPEELMKILMNQNADVDITEDAAQLIVARTKFSGAPWEAIELFEKAEDFAKAEQRPTIIVDDVQAVFEIFEIDNLGLRWMDRTVVAALFRRPRFRGRKQEFTAYAASEGDLCAMAGIDAEDYRTTVKHRLMSRGLIEVRQGYGQALTQKAIDLYKTSLGEA